MSISTTYPSGHGIGKTFLEEGLVLETHQGYALVPTTATGNVTFLDVNSPNPDQPINLNIPASATLQRAWVSIHGAILNGPISLSAAGTLKIVPSSIGQVADATLTATGTQLAAAYRNKLTGALITGTTLNTDGVFTFGGAVTNGFQTANVRLANENLLLVGSTNDTSTSTGLNFNYQPPNRQPIVLVTVRSLVRKLNASNASQYPGLPPSVLKILNS
jgi:hypothetical protein